MISSGATVNYKDTYFEYPELDKIQGEPTPDTLLTLKNQLKANASSVPSNLGDGNHGHLALVLHPDKYALISNVPFQRPQHPGILTMPANVTGPQAEVLRQQYQERMRIFREVTGVDKALKQQIAQAIQPVYLLAIRDRTTNSLSGTVSQILDYLFTTYGNVSVTALADKESAVRSITYHQGQPIDFIFNEVEDLVEYSELANQPLSQAQTVSVAYLILHRSGKLKHAITEWNRKPVIERTWINFKTHFRDAHKELRETDDTTIGDSILHQHEAALVRKVVDGVRDTINVAPDDATTAILQQMVNSTSQTVSIHQQLLAQLQQMQSRLQCMEAQFTQPSPFMHPTATYPFPSFVPFPGKTQGNRKQRSAPPTHLYCWTHGACGHKSGECRSAKPGHKWEATFDNKMGGSTKKCPPGNATPIPPVTQPSE